ncbi:MAG: lysylphosphatidylglycerol synthase transmembrane domain-containing protein [bacterium]
MTQALERRRRVARVAISAVATAAMLGFVASRVGVRRLGEALALVDPAAATLLVAWNAILHALVPAEKWRRILRHLGFELSLRDTLVIWLGCQPLRFTLPLKSGEIFKVVYLERVHGVPPAVGAWAVLFDKLANIVALVTLGAAGLLWAPLGGRASVAIVVLLALGPLLLARAAPAWLARALERIPGRLGRFVRDLVGAVSRLSVGVRLGFLGVSALQALAEGVSFALCLHALGASVPLVDALVRTPLVILLANLPVTLSGIGTRELGMLLLFAPYGRAETLAAAGLVLSFVGPVLLVLLGAPFVGRFFAATFARTAATGEALEMESLDASPRA